MSVLFELENATSSSASARVRLEAARLVDARARAPWYPHLGREPLLDPALGTTYFLIFGFAKERFRTPALLSPLPMKWRIHPSENGRFVLFLSSFPSRDGTPADDPGIGPVLKGKRNVDRSGGILGSIGRIGSRSHPPGGKDWAGIGIDGANGTSRVPGGSIGRSSTARIDGSNDSGPCVGPGGC